MNTKEFKKGYLANLKLEILNNKKNLLANKLPHSTNQYIQNTGIQIPGISTFKDDTNIQAKRNKK